MGIMDPTRFNLRVWFAVTGFTVIALLTAAFAMVMSSFLTTTMLDREVAVTQEFLQSILATEGYGERGFANRQRSRQDETLHGIRRPHTADAGDPAGESLQHGQAHRLVDRPGADRSALRKQSRARARRWRARLVSEVGRLDGNDKPEHVALAAGATGHFIEAYMPMWRGAKVIGVVELYKVPTALEAAIARGHRIIEGSAAVAGLVLFGTLYWIVRRGALLIQRQQTEFGRMEALAAVGQMASAIAHSLRNPLAGIRSSAELLRLEHPCHRAGAG